MATQLMTTGKKENPAGGTGMKWKPDPLALVALILAAVALVFIWKARLFQGNARQIAFVDTQRLMTGFKEAHKVNKELEAEDGKWKADFKSMEDSLKTYMETMTAKFDAADVKTKRQMQDELAMRNQQINNFQRYHTKRMQDMTQEKMQGVYAKINAFMKEYGTAEGYEIIFGTANGSILYGEKTPADITDKVIQALSKKYE
jgi:outer membrane protein